MFFVLTGQRFAGVEDVQDQLRLRERFAAAADALALNLVARFAQAGGIDEHHGNATNIRRLLNCVASRAGDVRDDGTVAPEKLVEQAGFTSIRPPDDRGANAATQN